MNPVPVMTLFVSESSLSKSVPKLSASSADILINRFNPHQIKLVKQVKPVKLERLKQIVKRLKLLKPIKQVYLFNRETI